LEPDPITVRQALQRGTAILGKQPDAQPRLETEILLALVLGTTRSRLFAWPEQTLTDNQHDRLESLLERRRRGEPIAYLSGKKEFWSMEFRVTPATLIPRPETELLVERALQLIPHNQAYTIADLGTGSGAIAAAIAAERPLSALFATDNSAEALAVAEENFRHHELRNIQCRRGSWCHALPANRQFDLLLSNPPYVAEGDPHLQQDGLPWEPKGALTAGADGLNEIRRIVQQAPSHLRAGGWLLLEHGFEQGPAVRALLQQAGYEQICSRRDLAGQERISEASLTC
jgi:release factor glutamine methyltransferase